MRKIFIIIFIINTFGFADTETEIIDATKRVSTKLLGKIVKSQGLKISLKTLKVSKKILLKTKSSYIEVLNKYIQNKNIVTGASKQILKYNKYINQIKSLELKVNKLILEEGKKTKATKYFFDSFGKLGWVFAGLKVGYSRYQFMDERTQLQKDFPNMDFKQGEWDLFKQDPWEFLRDNTVEIGAVLVETATFGLTATNYAGGSIFDEAVPTGNSSEEIDNRQKWLTDMLGVFKADKNHNKWFIEPSNHNLNIAVYCFLQIVKNLNSKTAEKYGLLDYHQLDWLKYYSITKTHNVNYNAFLAEQDKARQNIVYGELPFNDIETPQWAKRVIRKAKAQKLSISGYTSGTLKGSFGTINEISNVEVLKWIVNAYGIRQILPDDAPISSNGGADAFNTPLNNFYKDAKIDWTNAYYKYFIETKYISSCGITKDNLLEPATRKTVAQLLFNVFKFPIREHFGSYGEEGENKKLENIRKNETSSSWFYEAAVLKKLQVVFGQCPVNLKTCKPEQRQFGGSRQISRIEALAMIVRLNSYKYCNKNTCTFEEYFEGN